MLRVQHPAEAKAIGRRVRDFDAAVWESNCVEIVVTANTATFGQHDDLRSYLLGTGDRFLVEASPRDTVWGVGVGRERAMDPRQWRGRSLLGFALMEARDRLRSG